MKRFMLLIADIATLYGSLAVLLLVRYGSDAFMGQWGLHVVPFSLIFVVWVLALYIVDLYDFRALQNRRDFYASLLRAVIMAGAVSALFFYAVPFFGIAPRVNLFLFIVVFVVLVSLVRSLLNSVLRHAGKKRVLIVGVNERTLELIEVIENNPQLGYGLSFVADVGQETLLDRTERAGNVTILKGLSDVRRAIYESRVDVIVVSPDAWKSQELIAVLYDALHRHVNFYTVASFSERLTGKVPLDSIGQEWFLENFTEGSKRTYELGKRATDILLALCIGAAVLVLTPFIALAIRLDSRGPILFRQRRSGRAGSTFEMLKFRTMGTDAERHTGAVWAQTDDPRITRIGRFLRTSRLDELPQLWNILRGHMSLVGPRAERPEFDAKLIGQVPFYRERYLIKPGLTGWAQIKYSYGASVKDTAEKLQYDLYYIKNRSFLLDLEIILKTVNIAARRAGR